MSELTDFFLERIVVGPLQVNCYLLGCRNTNQAMIIDPGDEPEKIAAAVERHTAEVCGILLTHGHYDHIGAVVPLQQVFECPVLIHRAEAEALTNPQANFSAFTGDPIAGTAPDQLLGDNEKVAIGDLKIDVLHTPGHSLGGITLCHNGFAIVGDLIFLMSIGRTDLPGGSFPQLENSIRTRIYTLPDETVLYPGHGEPTTVGFEKRHNQFVPER
ncbi:MAG: MBL fold metallo-hydrolase [bacterium]